VQSLPFLAAAALAAIDGTRLNDFAFWRGTDVRLIARLADIQRVLAGLAKQSRMLRAYARAPRLDPPTETAPQ